MHPKVYEAARSGNFENLMKKISENGEDLLLQTTPKENNILHVAALYKQVKLIKLILQCPSGSSLLWQGNRKGDTPLHVAAKVGSYEAVRCFTDLTKSLHWVIENGQTDACKELLRKRNSHKDTALHYAIRGGHDGVVKLLIDEDPQLCDITNAANESPLYLAAERKHHLTTELILGACSLSSSHKGPRGYTALHAAMHRSLTSCEKIMEKRPEMIREGDDIRWTPLHYASLFGKVEDVRLLLRRDTSVAYDLDKEGESALHIAAFMGHVNVIDELVRSCPDACDITNTKGQTPLHAAVIGGQVKAVKYLMGMPNLEDLINEQDNNGNTALHLAALHKLYKIIYILGKDKRADRFATNKDHLTALDIFCAHKEIGYKAAKVQYMLKSNGTPDLQDRVINDVKKRLDEQFIKDQPAVSITTKSNTTNREILDSSERSFIKIQLLVAVLIATVTFAATFTMPGGYNNNGPNQGLATLAGEAAFKAFVTSNTIAFGLSTLAIYLQFDTSSLSELQQARYTRTAAFCIYYAIIGMVLAFGSGTYAVLTGTIGIGVIPYVLAGCLVIIYLLGLFLDPNTRFGRPRDSFGEYLRKILFDCGLF